MNRVSYSGFIVNDEVGPTRSSRALAIEHVAMFDAWNSIHHDFTPYLILATNANGASDVAAVAQAGHDTLLAMYPHQQAFIDAALTKTLARGTAWRDGDGVFSAWQQDLSPSYWTIRSSDGGGSSPITS